MLVDAERATSKLEWETNEKKENYDEKHIKINTNLRLRRQKFYHRRH